MVVDPVGCLGVGLVEVCLEVLSADAPLAAATDAGCGQMLSAHERVYLRSACVQDFSDIDESEQSGVHPQHRKSHAGAHAVIHTDDGQRTLAVADLVVTSKGADWLRRRRGRYRHQLASQRICRLCATTKAAQPSSASE
jgi:hypothetical protein